MVGLVGGALIGAAMGRRTALAVGLLAALASAALAFYQFSDQDSGRPPDFQGWPEEP